MSQSHLDALLRRKTINRISEIRNDDLTEHLLDNYSGDSPVIKNLCTRVSAPLADEIDSICATLGMSKRAFCESAFLEAVKRAKQIMDDEGFHEAIKQATSEEQGSLDL